MNLMEGEVRICAKMQSYEERELTEVLKDYGTCFAFHGELENCGMVAHEIRTGEAKPVSVGPVLRPGVEREAVEAQMKEWLKQGVIRASQSPWASRVVTVKKPDGSVRCCIDYRTLNAMTENS